ncbi:FG-GAP repeat protein, partial [Candidatus Pacearchaeota archaeon]|nr:FG-GAP repeat protein [Candidatus Pacearchaeota archaeon]
QKNATSSNYEQIQKITASDGASYDYFGGGVSISGDYAIVGARGDDDKGSQSGSAYFFERTVVVPYSEQKITASDGISYDYFGGGVSISGDYAIVGAYNDVNGSVYIFQKNATGQYEELNKIVPSDGASHDFFGYSVSISGDYAIVGAYLDDDKGSQSGSAYIFKKNATGQFEEVNKIVASDGAAGDFFGLYVAIDGDYAIVGALLSSSSTGAAYIFKKNATGQYEELNKITASDGASGDFFGYSVSISGDYAIVGAYQDDDDGLSSGSAYIFQKNATGQYEELNKITASDGAADDFFGYSVSISGDYAIVGALLSSSSTGAAYIFKKNATGQYEEVNKITASDGAADDFFGFSVEMDGDYAIVSAYGCGSAYIFKKNATGQFEEQNKIIPSDGATNKMFGYIVSISGDYAIAGAERDSDKGTYSGAAYIYYIRETTPTANKFAIKNSAGNNIASIDDAGNMFLAQSVYDGQSSLNPPANSFVVKDNSGAVIAYVNTVGELYLKGTVYILEVSGRTSTNLEFRDSSNDLVGFFDNQGNLRLKGRLYVDYTSP